jgi:choline-sulfatase
MQTVSLLRLSLLWTNLVLSVPIILGPASASAGAVKKPNVLFIVIDDQNDWLGCLGHPEVQTPNIDRLASRGTLFTNAHSQAPICNASRASVLTGLRPSSTGIYGLTPGIRDVDVTKNQVTLPQTFTEGGYFTYTCGKVYHDGSIKPKDQPREFNEWGPAPSTSLPAKRFVNLPMPDQILLMDWGPWPKSDEEVCDYAIASAAIKTLQNLPKDKPFFVACGFRLPHVPLYVPQKWFDLYPDDKLVMPRVLDTDRDDTPRFSWYLTWKDFMPRLRTLKEANQWRSLVQSYVACTSFMDAQAGRVLATLDATGRAKDTIVVLWSDHGWHLGEKLITGKLTLWERSTHVPLILAGPGIGMNAKCSSPAELLDLFPTLLDLCHFPARPDLEGHSLLPLLKDANAHRPWPAITTACQDNHAVRDNRWRYIRYADGSEELYDRQKDPNEWVNLAGNPQYASTKERLKKWLPKKNLPSAPGSTGRVLNYNPVTGVATWEGKDISPDAPITD